MKRILNKIGVFVIIVTLFATYSCDNASKKEEQQNQKILQEKLKKIQEKQRIINNITFVLQSDNEISNFSNHDPKKQAEAMRNIDISKCPSDFSVAYLDHIHAWENAARVDKVWKEWNSDENVNNIIVEAFLNELLNTNTNTYENVVEIENELKKQRVEATNKIRTTWEDVERIAVRYGAKLPTTN